MKNQTNSTTYINVMTWKSETYLKYYNSFEIILIDNDKCEFGLWHGYLPLLEYFGTEGGRGGGGGGGGGADWSSFSTRR